MKCWATKKKARAQTNGKEWYKTWASCNLWVASATWYRNYQASHSQNT